jgi:hypothetical protein
VHAIRTFLLIPLFAFVNAQFLANQHDVRMVFHGSLLLAPRAATSVQRAATSVQRAAHIGTTGCGAHA